MKIKRGRESKMGKKKREKNRKIVIIKKREN